MTKEIRTTGQWIDQLNKLTDRLNKASRIGMQFTFIYNKESKWPWELWDLNNEKKDSMADFSVATPEQLETWLIETTEVFK